jgi:hypothetical protein
VRSKEANESNYIDIKVEFPQFWHFPEGRKEMKGF